MPATPVDRPSLVQVCRLQPYLEQALAERYDVVRLIEQADPQAYLSEHGARFSGAVTSAINGIDATQIAALPNVKIISSLGVGLDSIALDAARARGIAVGYTPDLLSDCVADAAMALLLAIARRIAEADRFVRAGRWTERGMNSFVLGRRVSGARLGIVGLGRIGRTIARRAGGFDMDVRYHSRRPVADAPWGFEASLPELARWADYLVVATAGGPDTRHLIDTTVLEALGPRSFLINIARGSVVDEAALVTALEQGRIAGAGLDVFEDEPQVPPALRELDNVVLLPHIASATEETRRAMADLVLDNLDAFYRTGRPLVAAT